MTREEALLLLDDVESLVRFCAVHMPDVERYNRGGESFWKVVHWIAEMPKTEKMMTSATWSNGRSTRSGKWEYVRHSDTFHIWLDKPVGFGGEMRKFLSLLGYEVPEWGKWKRID